jgi:hypothetical protein
MNQLSQAESYGLIRVTNGLKLIERSKKIAERRDDEEAGDGIFVPDRIGKTAGDVDESGGQSFDQAVDDGQPVWDHVVTDTAKKVVKRRKPAKTAREVEERRREDERKKTRKKMDMLTMMNRPQKQRGLVPSNTLKVKTLKKGRGRKPREYKSRMKTRGDRGSEDTLGTMVESLMRSDAIKERQAQGDFGEAPEIHERSKEGQMDALMASVPQDYDTHKSKAERSDLLKASKIFGNKKVTASGGKWKLKGMKSQL